MHHLNWQKMPCVCTCVILQESAEGCGQSNLANKCWCYGFMTDNRSVIDSHAAERFDIVMKTNPAVHGYSHTLGFGSWLTNRLVGENSVASWLPEWQPTATPTLVPIWIFTLKLKTFVFQSNLNVLSSTFPNIPIFKVKRILHKKSRVICSARVLMYWFAKQRVLKTPRLQVT